MYAAMDFFREYFWESSERKKALGLLFGAIISTFALFALVTMLSWWTSGFWAAITAKDTALLAYQMKVFLGLGASGLALNFINNLCIKALDACWYQWLSNKLISQYTADDNSTDNNFVELNRFQSELSNPQQRLLTDIKTFVKGSLTLSFEVLGAVLRFAFSVRTLWVLGGGLGISIAGLSLTIPGFLVWVSLINSAIFSLTLSFIGKQLASMNERQKLKESELQQQLDVLEHNAESIALEKGQRYYRRVLREKVNEIKNIRDNKVWLESKIASFQAFKHLVMKVLPILAAIPLVFSGVIDVAVLMQVSFLFDLVSSVFDVFMTQFEEYANFKSSLNRIVELRNGLSLNGLSSNKKGIQTKSHTGRSIRIDQLEVAYPKKSSTRKLFEGLNMTINTGENVLLEGENGAGKSTFLKVLRGTWRYGQGHVSLPENTMFLPQRTQIPKADLRAILQYPNEDTVFSTKAMQAALCAVGLNDLADKLDDDKHDWHHSLSLGEQQKIGFARVLLNKPEVLFLDETTASLSRDNEQQLYQMLIEKLPDTTIVSIGHRAGIKKFHQRHLFFSRGSDVEPANVSESTVSAMSL